MAFSNPSYLNDKGEEVVLITAVDPRTSHLKQFERDCYDSGLVAGIKSEQARIIKLLEDERLLCSSEKYCWTSVEYKCECERTRALIKGEQK